MTHHRGQSRGQSASRLMTHSADLSSNHTDPGRYTHSLPLSASSPSKTGYSQLPIKTEFLGHPLRDDLKTG